MLHPSVGRRRREFVGTKLVLKGGWVALQNGFSRQLNVDRMQGGVVTALTAALGTTCRANGKALAIQFQAAAAVEK
jgi:hypothetical protein